MLFTIFYGISCRSHVCALTFGGLAHEQTLLLLRCCCYCCCISGHAMLSSETVRKIGFTGSTAVGKMLAEQAAKVRSQQVTNNCSIASKLHKNRHTSSCLCAVFSRPCKLLIALACVHVPRSC
jgi:hypothetical protein